MYIPGILFTSYTYEYAHYWFCICVLCFHYFSERFYCCHLCRLLLSVSTYNAECYIS